MTCPKKIAHGPCGAMWQGMCEVGEPQPCVFANLTRESDVSDRQSSGEGCAHEFSSDFAEKLESGQFVITGEVAPPKGVDCGEMIASIRAWAPHCDAVNITDNQGASLRLSSLSASRIAQDEGVEAIFQQTCRDRNRLALQSDLLAAHMYGLRNYLAVTGDNPASRTATRRVFDLDSTQLLRVASGLNRGVDAEGNSIGTPTSFYLGAAAFLEADPWEAQYARIAQKIEAGARFFQTQAVMDTDKALGRIEQVQKLGGKVIVGVLLLKSTGVIDFINNRLEGLHVPEHLKAYIADAKNPLDAAVEIACEQTRAFAEAADGVHIMPLGEDAAGIEVATCLTTS